LCGLQSTKGSSTPTHTHTHTYTHTHTHTHTGEYIILFTQSMKSIKQISNQAVNHLLSRPMKVNAEAKSRRHRLTNLSLPAKSTSTGVLFLSVCCTVSPPLALGSRPPAMFRLRLWRRWFDSHHLAARDFVQICNAADSRSAQPFDQLWLTKSADSIIVPRPKPAETKWKSVALLTNDDAKS